MPWQTTAVPATHLCMATSQVSRPLQALPSSQPGLSLQVKVHLLVQPSASSALPSSHSSPWSTAELPQPAFAQVPLRQAPAPPPSIVQGVAAAGGVPALHSCLPGIDLSQVSVPVQTFLSSQSPSLAHS